MIAGVLVLTLLSIAADRDERDELDLKNGRTVKGRIILDLNDRLVLRSGSRERAYRKADVIRYTSIFQAQGEFLERFAVLEKESIEALLRLADFCRLKRLLHEERLLYWRILLIEPEHEAANARLGHQYRRGRWLIPVRGGAVRFAALLERRRDWGKAWELRSEHYAIKSDAELKQVLDALLELEAFYRYFFRLYQRKLEFREVLEPMAVQLSRDRSRFPVVSTHVETHFEELMNVLHTYVLDRRPVALFHEATQQLLHNVNDNAAQGRGALPGWLVKGWAEYMEGLILVPRPGRPVLHPGRRIEERFRLVRENPKRYGLHRVLNFARDDFDSSAKQNLKYAQSYVLFHYLMHAQGGHFQARFFSYLREAMRGKGQASTFRDVFDASKIEGDLVNYC